MSWGNTAYFVAIDYITMAGIGLAFGWTSSSDRFWLTAFGLAMVIVNRIAVFQRMANLMKGKKR